MEKQKLKNIEIEKIESFEGFLYIVFDKEGSQLASFKTEKKAIIFANSADKILEEGKLR